MTGLGGSVTVTGTVSATAGTTSTTSITTWFTGSGNCTGGTGTDGTSTGEFGTSVSTVSLTAPVTAGTTSAVCSLVGGAATCCAGWDSRGRELASGFADAGAGVASAAVRPAVVSAAGVPGAVGDELAAGVGAGVTRVVGVALSPVGSATARRGGSAD